MVHSTVHGLGLLAGRSPSAAVSEQLGAATGSQPAAQAAVRQGTAQQAEDQPAAAPAFAVVPAQLTAAASSTGRRDTPITTGKRRRPRTEDDRCVVQAVLELGARVWQLVVLLSPAS